MSRAPIALTFLLVAFMPPPGAALAQTPTNVLVIPRCAQSPTIDGTINPAEWSGAAAVTGFMHVFGYMTQRQTVVWVTYDDARLYLAWHSAFPPDTKLRRVARERDARRLCADDAIELFVAPDFADALALEYQFLGNSLGVIQDFERRRNLGNSLMLWNGAWDFECTTGEGWWDSELAIDLDQLKLRTDREFGINICRDHAMYYFTNWTPGRFSDFARATFGGDCPVVQMLDLGNALGADLSARFALRGGGDPERLTLAVQVHDSADGALLAEDSRTVDLAPGAPAEVILRADWTAREGEVRPPPDRDDAIAFRQWLTDTRRDVTIAVTDAGGRALLTHHLPVNPGLVDPIQTAEPRAFEVFADLYPSYGVLRASADIYDFPQKERAERVAVVLQPAGQQWVAGCGMIAEFELGYGETDIRHLPLAPGTYQVAFHALDAAGQVLATEVTELEVPPPFEWEGTHAGTSGRVIAPFTPLEVAGSSVRCWGREYAFSPGALPLQLTSRGAAMLAGPVAVEGRAAGERLRFEPFGDLEVLSADDPQVRLRGYSRAGDLRLESEVTVEYDGMMRFDLTLAPDRAVRVRDLRLEIPLHDQHALLYHACGESIRLTNQAGYLPAGEGVIWDSRAIPNAQVLGSFIPYLWLGDYDRGLCWMAESDRGWVTDEDRPCLELVRDGGRLVLRVNLVQRAIELDQPRTLSFALQAGPARPEPLDWRVDEGPFWYYNVKTSQGYGRPPDLEAFREFAGKFREENGVGWGINTSPNDLWGVTPTNLHYAVEWYPGVPTVRRNDFCMYWTEQLIAEGLIDGLYSDDTYPLADADLVTGRGWVREDGRVQSSYPMFALRDFFQRAATIFREHDCRRKLMIHMTDAMVLPCYGSWDLKLDNEWFRGQERGGLDTIDCYDLGEVCARSLSRQWGMGAHWHWPAGWHNSLTGGAEQATLLLLHDIVGRVDCMDNRTRPAKELFGFGEPDVEFLGYWALQPERDPRVKDVKLSAWVRRGQGTALVVVGNLGEEDFAGTLRLPLGLMGLARDVVACDGEDQHAAVPLRDGAFDIAVGRHDFRLLLVGPPGRFPADLPAPGIALERPAQPIAELCDDFEAGELSAAWRLVASPVSEGELRLHRGRLQVYGSDYKFAAAERDFGEDNVSVQVRVEVRGRSHQNYTGLVLLWANGNYVYAGSGLKYPAFEYEALTGGQRARRRGAEASVANPGAMHQVNWVRIDLTPEQIVFYGSADGVTWSRDWELERPEDLAGAPAVLRLGKSPHGLEDPHKPGPSPAYFDDLIVGR